MKTIQYKGFKVNPKTPFTCNNPRNPSRIGTVAAMAPMDYKHPGAIRAIQVELECSESVAHELFGDLVNFLWLSGKSTEATMPTPAIDVAWHAFLQFEPEYKVFCDVHCGGYIVHEPNPDPAACVSVDVARSTIDQAVAVFGGKPSRHWDFIPLSEWSQAA